MGLKETTKTMYGLLSKITHDLAKSERGNRAAAQRVRTGTVKLEKVAKRYRKESVEELKANTKSSGKKSVRKKKLTKSRAKRG